MAVTCLSVSLLSESHSVWGLNKNEAGNDMGRCRKAFSEGRKCVLLLHVNSAFYNFESKYFCLS